MALADIINKIESDAATEAAAIAEAAEKRAADVRADAEEKAAQYREEVLVQAREAASREASRIVVAAKLVARDKALAERRSVIDEALAKTAEKLAELPQDRYVDFLAKRIAEVARGGETLHFGSADSGVGSAVADRLASLRPELTVTIATEPAPFARGALLQGDRVRADLSLMAIVEDSRDELELVLADAIFGEGA